LTHTYTQEPVSANSPPRTRSSVRSFSTTAVLQAPRVDERVARTGTANKAAPVSGCADQAYASNS
jgi:hypothetical protein